MGIVDRLMATCQDPSFVVGRLPKISRRVRRVRGEEERKEFTLAATNRFAAALCAARRPRDRQIQAARDPRLFVSVWISRRPAWPAEGRPRRSRFCLLGVLGVLGALGARVCPSPFLLFFSLSEDCVTLNVLGTLQNHYNLRDGTRSFRPTRRSWTGRKLG